MYNYELILQMFNIKPNRGVAEAFLTFFFHFACTSCDLHSLFLSLKVHNMFLKYKYLYGVIIKYYMF